MSWFFVVAAVLTLGRHAHHTHTHTHADFLPGAVMYFDCIAWVSSTDCLDLTTVYQLLHPDWRNTTRKRQHGWTRQHDALLKTLMQQLLNGEIPSIYYATTFEYQLAAKKHLTQSHVPFLSEPKVMHVNAGFRALLPERSSVDKMTDDYDADDENDVLADVAYTEKELRDLFFPPKQNDTTSAGETSDSFDSSSQPDVDEEFLVYSVDLSTNQTRAYTYQLTEVDLLRGKFKSYSSWEILSSSEWFS